MSAYPLKKTNNDKIKWGPTWFSVKKFIEICSCALAHITQREFIWCAIIPIGGVNKFYKCGLNIIDKVL